MGRVWAAALALLLSIAPWPARAQLTAEELYEKLSASVWLVQVRLERGSALGSAVVIAPETLITNCHVIAGGSEIFVRHDAVRLKAQLVHRDPWRDLCEIRAPGLDAPAVTIGDWRRLRIGARLFAIGNPGGLELTLSDGLLSGIRRGRGSVEALQFTVPISKGSSGGGLFDTNGHLVGITTSIFRDAQNIGFALPATWIGELRSRAGARDPLPIQTAYAPGSVAPPANEDAPATLDTFEYVLRDRLTGVSRKVVYRVDRREGSLVVLNGGSRIEDGEGRVVTLTAAPGGEFEQAMPPGGWFPGTGGGQRLSRYQAFGDGSPFIMELRAESESEEMIELAGVSMRTVRVHFTGISQRGLSAVRGTYRATVWYAPELQRIVRFEAQGRGGVGSTAFVVDEVLELVNASTRPTNSQ
ncbi:S1C family serine protease [Ramlibacter humi]|uniref:Serine protease n=1 Tax=Ramlibacter humi TaxID=2530451 RepID=A0A4Z0CCE9_9BURK|nr:S1C family serine protease [Ramlibacter humi]TFZ08070.1 serine protease [Ramlibacter humi]